MVSRSTPPSLKTFFARLLRVCFEELDLDDDVDVVDHLADVLARHGRPGAAPTAPPSFADHLRAVQEAWTPGPAFDPGREVALQQALGDGVLFQQGFFWEQGRETSTRRHWLRQGRRAYRFVARYQRARRHPAAPLYAALAAHLDMYAAVISYMRDVHLGAEFGPTPRTAPARFTIP